MRDLLGGKGANLAEMTAIGLPVPDGFTITTEACLAFLESGERSPDGLAEQVGAAVESLEERVGAKLGGAANPLLGVGAIGRAGVDAGDDGHDPQPGAERPVGGCPDRDHRRRPVCPRLLPAADSDVRKRRDGRALDRFEDLLGRMKLKRGVTADVDLDGDALAELVAAVPGALPRRPGTASRRARGSSSTSRSRRCSSRGTRRGRSPTGAGNTSPTTWEPRSTCSRWCSATPASAPGTGVAFTRNPSTGEAHPYGEFLQNAQGEDVVSGARTGLPLDELGRLEPDAYRSLLEVDDAAREPLRRHAGPGVHCRSGAALHAADTQRQAGPAGGSADRCGHGRRGRDRARCGGSPGRCQPARARAAAHGQSARRPPGDRNRPAGLCGGGGRRGRVRCSHRGGAGGCRRGGRAGAR